MRINEITRQDPVFTDHELVEILARYLGTVTLNSLYQMSPYTPGSGNERWQNRYDNIVATVKPMLKQPEPDIHAIIKTLDKQIPIVGLPSWLKDQIITADKNYKDFEKRNPIALDPGQKATWSIVDELIGIKTPNTSSSSTG